MRKDLHGRGREDTPRSPRRLAFVSSDKENGNRKCHWATAWREWGTKLRKQAKATARREGDSAQALQLRLRQETFRGRGGAVSMETCQRSHLYLLQRTGTKMQLNL